MPIHALYVQFYHYDGSKFKEIGNSISCSRNADDHLMDILNGMAALSSMPKDVQITGLDEVVLEALPIYAEIEYYPMDSEDPYILETPVLSSDEISKLNGLKYGDMDLELFYVALYELCASVAGFSNFVNSTKDYLSGDGTSSNSIKRRLSLKDVFNL